MIVILKTTVNIGKYCPHVFRVRSGPNQSYSLECYWDFLSTSSMQKVKEGTLESE